MTTAAQLVAIFVFGLLITGVVFMGLLRAREVQDRAEKAKRVELSRERET